jgi:Skp family chaperone for outer membrane proteins
MKYTLKTSLFFVLFVAFSLKSHSQRGTRVGYIDMDYILERVDEYNKASTLLDKNIENWKKEIELKKLELQQYQDQLNELF